MDIRPYKDTDIAEISRLYFNTVRRVNSRDYTPDQIQAWAPGIPPAVFWIERFKKRNVIVAEDHTGVVGFAEVGKSGHIDCFYVHHLFQGKGIGTALLRRVFEELGRQNVHRAHAEVSITAKPFFESKGFTVKEERDVEYNAVRVKLFLMEKYI